VDVATSAFAGEPQPVEIYHRGIWYSGHLLGWRHDTDGRCLARVSCVVGKLKHKAWKDLAELRLPESSADPTTALPLVGPAGRRTDDLPDPEDDATRPHVLLADLRARPRTPTHAKTPPPARPRTRTEGASAEGVDDRRASARPSFAAEPCWTVTRDWLSTV